LFSPSQIRHYGIIGAAAPGYSITRISFGARRG